MLIFFMLIFYGDFCYFCSQDPFTLIKVVEDLRAFVYIKFTILEIKTEKSLLLIHIKISIYYVWITYFMKNTFSETKWWEEYTALHSCKSWLSAMLEES